MWCHRCLRFIISSTVLLGQGEKKKITAQRNKIRGELPTSCNQSCSNDVKKSGLKSKDVDLINQLVDQLIGWSDLCYTLTDLDCKTNKVMCVNHFGLPELMKKAYFYYIWAVYRHDY